MLSFRKVKQFFSLNLLIIIFISFQYFSRAGSTQTNNSAPIPLCGLFRGGISESENLIASPNPPESIPNSDAGCRSYCSASGPKYGDLCRRDHKTIQTYDPSFGILPVDRVVDFNCAIDSNNQGCSAISSCPAGYAPISIKAACNLETSDLPTDIMSLTAVSEVYVWKASNDPSTSVCQVGSLNVNLNKTKVISTDLITNQFEIACAEVDSTSGGDCQVRSQIQCKRQPIFDFRNEFVTNMLFEIKANALNDINVTQGLTRLGNYWLVTQDSDGSPYYNAALKNGGNITFSLIDLSGRFVRSWYFDYASHGMSLKVIPIDGGGYEIWTDGDPSDFDQKPHTGVAVFSIDSGLINMKFVKELKGPSTVRGFYVNRNLNVMARVRKYNSTNYMELLDYNLFRSGTEKLLNSYALDVEQQDSPTTSITIQGVTIDEGSIYVLAGDSSFTQSKQIFRYSFAGQVLAKVTPELDSAAIAAFKTQLMGNSLNKTFEPEGIFYSQNYLYYMINTGSNGKRIPYLIKIQMP